MGLDICTVNQRSSQLPTAWQPVFSTWSYNRTLLEQNFRDWLAYVLHAFLMKVGRIKKGAQENIAKTHQSWWKPWLLRQVHSCMQHLITLQPCPPVSLHSLQLPPCLFPRSIYLVLSYDPGHVTSAVGVTPVLEPSLEAWWGPWELLISKTDPFPPISQWHPFPTLPFLSCPSLLFHISHCLKMPPLLSQILLRYPHLPFHCVSDASCAISEGT